MRVHDVLSTDPAHRSAVNVRPLRHGHPRGTLGRSNSTCWPSRSGCSARRSALLGAGAITAAALLITAWVALRRAGPAVALGVTVLLALTTWSTGTAVLTDPISSNIGGYPLLAGAVLAWALLLGDLRLLPLAVAVVSFAAQQHLAMVIPAGAVSRRWRRSAPSPRCTTSWRDPAARPGPCAGCSQVRRSERCWLPIAIDQVTGDPGNLTAVLRFSEDMVRNSRHR